MDEGASSYARGSNCKLRKSINIMKTAKVVSVSPKGDFSFNGKTFYKFFVTMDNGDSGEYNSVKADQDKFTAGAEVEYEISSNQYGNKIKPVYNGGGGGSYSKPSYSGNNDDKQKMIVKQSCLKAAVDLLKDKGAKSTDVLKVADAFVEWVLEQPKQETNYNTHFSSREEKIETAQAIASGEPVGDDLPF
jgi:hypothetical protein